MQEGSAQTTRTKDTLDIMVAESSIVRDAVASFADLGAFRLPPLEPVIKATCLNRLHDE